MAFLELIDVRKSFGTVTAVQSFNLQVERGEFVSFLGPSGCGKTTTLRMIAGFEMPTSGKITVSNQDLTYKPPNKRNVGMVFQSYALFPNMTIAENIGFGLTIAKRPKEMIQKRVQEMLALIHMESLGGRYPYQLSGGQQQRVALARAIAFQPQVLLLDEPLSALDAKIRVSLRSEIRAIQRQLGITTIYVTHDQEEALSLSDRVVVMNDGHIEQVGTPFEIYNFPQTEFAAHFVGTLNTIPAEIRDAPRGCLAVDNQEIKTAHDLDGATPGEHVSISIRPERISMYGEIQKVNVMQVAVETITFLGSIVRIQVRAGSHVFYMDTFNNPFLDLPKIGEKIQITFSAEAVLVLRTSQASAPVTVGAESTI
jgi:putative spermidine/putrescine transport system ATP-binding protein